MSLKMKLTCTIVAIALIFTVLIVGVLSAKSVTQNIGGRVEFQTTGVMVTISDGKLDGQIVTVGEKNKMQGFTIDNKTTSQAISDKLNSWTGLNIVRDDEDAIGTVPGAGNESKAVLATITFTIKNDDTVKSLNINTVVSNGSHADDENSGNMVITSVFTGEGVTTTEANTTVEPGKTATVNISFTVNDKEVTTTLANFNIALVMSTIVA